jgi:DNA repair protein RecN (Recombination protein N)
MSAKPVAKVASGGELSRLSLAIAVATSQVGGCPTLIFDEVDSGIGGTVAHTVGQLMARLGHGRQVLAVTHLAQVAACAHHHVQVSKHASPAGVKSGVRLLSLEDRVTEVARMLGGSGVTEASVAHAREMLNHG